MPIRSTGRGSCGRAAGTRRDLDWCLRPGVKLDFRHFQDGYVATSADVEAELDRIGHELQPFDIVIVTLSIACDSVLVGRMIRLLAGTLSPARRPDRARFQAGIETRANTARQASTANGEKIAGIVAARRTLGDSERDIQNRTVRIQQKEYGPQGRATICPNSKQLIPLQ